VCDQETSKTRRLKPATGLFHAESEWNILTLLGSGHQTCMKLTSAECTVENPDDGQRRCPKHVEFYDRINLNN
jgi:hypothetical protein